MYGFNNKLLVDAINRQLSQRLLCYQSPGIRNTEIYAYIHVLAELDEPCFPVNDATIFIEL